VVANGDGHVGNSPVVGNEVLMLWDKTRVLVFVVQLAEIIPGGNKSRPVFLWDAGHSRSFQSGVHQQAEQGQANAEEEGNSHEPIKPLFFWMVYPIEEDYRKQ
jgi:hypothetical protein